MTRSGGGEPFLRAFAGDARAFLEPRWRDWHAAWGPPAPRTLSQWTCVRSSHFLARALRHAGVAAEVRVGWYRTLGAPTDAIPETHAWVEALGLLVDLTADQFGGPPIVVTTRDGPVYLPAEPAAGMLPLTPAGRLATDAIWPDWVAKRQTGRGLGASMS